MKKFNNYFSGVDNDLLKRNYMDACSDKDFSNYLDRLNIKEDLIIKNLSNIYDCYLEEKNYLNGDSDCLNNEVVGFIKTPSVYQNIINYSYVACPNKQNEINNTKYKKNIDLFDMSEEIKNASFDSIYKDDKLRMPILKYFKDFMNEYKKGEKPKGLYLNGSFGVGKTYLVAALFNEMAKKGHKSVLIYYPEFLRNLKASFSDNYNEKFESVKRAPLLLFDDIGAENCSNWARDEILGTILQYRMEMKLPTFFTSNLNLEELEVFLTSTSSGVDKIKARRIIERIKQLTTNIELVSENRRN